MNHHNESDRLSTIHDEQPTLTEIVAKPTSDKVALLLDDLNVPNIFHNQDIYPRKFRPAQPLGYLDDSQTPENFIEKLIQI